MSKSKKQSYGKQVENSNPSALAILFFIIVCIGIVMNVLGLFYVSYIKMSGFFLLGAIALLITSPLLFISAYDLYMSIKEHGNCFDKLDYIMLLIVDCSLIYAAIGIFIEYI